MALVVVAGLGVLAYQILSTKTHPVPALVGRDIAEVGNLIAEFEWELVVERERNDDQPFDAVIRTVPEEGEHLAEGDTFIVVVSDGPTLSVLPQLEGQPVDAAQAALESVGFSMVVSGLRFDEEVPNGSVISWSVPDHPELGAGDEVVKGTVVAVLVSQGPEPRTVPSLLGRDPAEVVAELLQLRLEPVEYPEIFSDDVEAGLVVAQEPPPGTVLERGSEVRYSLSKGPDVVPVPPLAGLDYEGVVRAIEEAGLQVGSVTGDNSLTLLGVSVGGSPVSAGQLFRRGTAVDLVYSFPP
jgi:serine/threonine-protein kinase